MSALIRFGVSIAKDLLEKFDAVISDQEYPTRSKAIEDLMRKAVDEHKLTDDKTVSVGSIDIIYDHHRRELLNKLTDIQHDFQETILSTQHIHLDHHNCFEIIVVKGEKGKIEKLASLIKSEKGVKHSQLRLAPAPQ
ncbi:MAG: nickel-responsive transcriptional regulator NikR [Endomicrobiales bacterium]|nr:nickel-responsive transcriptional regulator NikR [Endomicrobiales bacterium]